MNPGLCDISILAFSPRTPDRSGILVPWFLLSHSESLLALGGDFSFLVFITDIYNRYL